MYPKVALYNSVRDLRAKLREVYEKHDSDMNLLERYKGSEGYEKDRQEALKKLEADVAACKELYRESLYRTMEEFETMVAKACLPAPTSDQINILQVFQMQNNPSKDLLILAGRSLSNSPLALEALHSLAKDKNVRWPGELSTQFFTLSDAQNITHTLNSRVTDMLIHMKRPGDKSRYINDANASTTLLSYDFDHEDADQCFEAFAGVDHETAQKFFDFCSCHTNLRSMY